MKRILLSMIWICAVAACAVITVNIYFPEKDVQEAYRALEKELMSPGIQPDREQPEGQPEPQPQGFFRFRLVSTAYAQEAGMADKIAEIIKRMPDVVNAYREMGERFAETARLRDSGAAGEGNGGLLVVRADTLNAQDRDLVEKENENRKTIMEGMTKAIVRLNRLPQNEANLSQVRPQAIEQFAAIRRENAYKGWWIQLADGNWVTK